ncbi:PTS system trehalose-specific EIIBC component [Caldalkalibacillus salinus]|uniref:PTS system trehalose-specific EIIBC component n=1 Tax=Caldalkalibacillus salinus TaxID=2803787 RepID=UPI0019225E9C|nr:PTS system trehalose-specific EIIBC component [Caldalkalibacillus salinus]
MDIKQSTEQIIKAVGGKENISKATHCVTRLRFALVDEDQVDQEALEQVDAVKGAFSSNGQFQVVIGQGTVDKVYKALVEQTGIGASTKQDIKDEAEKKLNPLQRAIKTLADIFIPILPAIVTAGLLMGINNILTGPGIFFDEMSIVDAYPQWNDPADMINLIANTAFVFLPALIGWSAVRRFGGSELLGIVLGLMLVHPALMNAWDYAEAINEGNVPVWNIFGFEVQKLGYQGQVLPVLISAYILARIEGFLNKRVADAFKLLVVAPITLLLAGVLAFIVVGPVTFAIGNMITSAFVGVFEAIPALGGLIYGGLYALLVVTGMHHTFLAVDLQLIASTGATFLWPMLALSNIAQGSAALAMMFASKDENVKGLSFTSAISAYLGITEPAMFGVNLRFKYPFIFAMVGSAIAGLYITYQGVRATSIGVGGIPGFLSIFPEFWLSFFIGMGVVIVVPFVLTVIYGKYKQRKGE